MLMKDTCHKYPHINLAISLAHRLTHSLSPYPSGIFFKCGPFVDNVALHKYAHQSPKLELRLELQPELELELEPELELILAWRRPVLVQNSKSTVTNCQVKEFDERCKMSGKELFVEWA